MNRVDRLRQLVERQRPLIAMGAFDGVSARLVEREGFDCCYLGGFAAAASMLGMPDLGLVSGSEMVDHVRRLASAISLPVIADADTGYGNDVNVRRTLNQYRQAGVAGFHIEDQVDPKKCGHIAGKAVIDPEEMCLKIRAACKEREGGDFFIIARTDAIAVNGIDDAIERAKRYGDAGADALFLDAPESEAHIDRLCTQLAGLNIPLVFNGASTGKSPALTPQEAGQRGFRICLYPIEPMLAAITPMRRVMRQIKQSGTPDEPLYRGDGFTELKDLLDFEGKRGAETGRA